jgi:hypothetical protein
MPPEKQTAVNKGALIALLGFILSAPVAVPIVMLFAPQPVWSTVDLFKANYHPLQELPYYFGFVLIAGILFMVLGHRPEHYGDDKTLRIEINLAHGLVFVFTTLITYNYICQTTLIPHLVRAHGSQYDALIALFTMSNPDSLSWAIEMWGYLILAIALYFLQGCYRRKNTSLPVLLAVNLVMSFISTVWTILDPLWVSTSIGLILYFAWNALMIVILILIFRQSKHPSVSART